MQRHLTPLLRLVLCAAGGAFFVVGVGAALSCASSSRNCVAGLLWVPHSDPDTARSVGTDFYSLEDRNWKWPWVAVEPKNHAVKIDINQAAPDATIMFIDGNDAVVLDLDKMRKLIRRVSAEHILDRHPPNSNDADASRLR